MMIRSRVLVLVAALCGTLAAPAAAQDAGQGAAAVSPEMQAQIRQRIGEMVKRQLALTDSQYAQLAAVNKKYEGRRRELTQQEQLVRAIARAEVLKGDSADQQIVAKQIEQLIKIQKERIAILESEQRDLSIFLTPVQRAKYLAIQERIRKWLQQLRQQGGMGLTPQQMRRMQRQQQNPPPAATPPEE